MTNDRPNDNLDRVLSHEGYLVPSSGFVFSVMEAIHQEVAAPDPIHFPWKRALPGLAASLALAAVLVVSFAVNLRHATQKTSDWLASDNVSWMLKQIVHGSGTVALTGWIVVTLLLSLATMYLSMRIVIGRR